MPLRRSSLLRYLRRLRSRARRWARPACRVAVLVWFTIGSLGIPLVQASSADADADGETPSGIDAHVVLSLDVAEVELAAAEEELCVLPDLLVPAKPSGHCGCSRPLQAAGRCCCAAEQAPAARSCCAKSPATKNQEERPSDPTAEHESDGKRPVERFACLTCPCGSGSDAWIAVAAEPRILGDAVVLIAAGPPVERLVATTPHLPQVFLSPDSPPPRPADRSPTSL